MLCLLRLTEPETDFGLETDFEIHLRSEFEFGFGIGGHYGLCG